MILQALFNYYERKSADPESTIPPIGFAWKEIPFVIVLDKQGKIVDFQDTREKVEKKLIGRNYLLPLAEGRSGGKAWQTACLLWDHFGYVLGHPKGESSKDVTKAVNTLKKHFDVLSDEDNLEAGITEAIIYYEQFEFDPYKTINELGSFRKLLCSLPDSFQEKKGAAQLVASYEKDQEMAEKQLDSFQKKINQLPNKLKKDEGVAAVISFYET
ncbi:MAG: hypothetical protein D3910_21975, partial [Candidatus Electrothrix sp. ATG2]|nr:hypothetical protein [Candidatus Electrothrix sp. ATG2]